MPGPTLYGPRADPDSRECGLPLENQREPVFNLPKTIVVLVIVLTVIHTVRTMLPDRTDFEVIFTFGFVPARYDAASQYAGQFPGGFAADIWTFVSYSFLHGDWMHLIMNMIWMVAFATPVVRRFGLTRFLLLSAAASIGGALLHLSTHWGEVIPMVGASAAISGHMGAATRFAFQRQVMFGFGRPDDETRWRRPALPLLLAFRDIRVVAFVAVWFAANYLFGAASLMPGVEAAIAWQAHIGGFLVGLLLFPLFDIPKSQLVYPRPSRPTVPGVGGFTPPGPNGGGDRSGNGQNRGSE